MIRNDDGTQTNRYDSKENWLKVNPVLAQGEFVVEFDNGGFSVKVGDGNTAYKDLKYVSGLNASYPVGSIYMTMDSVNPNSLFGGIWELVKDRFLVGAGNSYQVGNTGGEASHTLTVDEMPSHNHWLTPNSAQWAGASDRNSSNSNISPQVKLGGDGLTSGQDGCFFADRLNEWKRWSGNTGGSKAHNNLPPYLAVNIWKRIS